MAAGLVNFFLVDMLLILLSDSGLVPMERLLRFKHEFELVKNISTFEGVLVRRIPRFPRFS